MQHGSKGIDKVSTVINAYPLNPPVRNDVIRTRLKSNLITVTFQERFHKLKGLLGSACTIVFLTMNMQFINLDGCTQGDPCQIQLKIKMNIPQLLRNLTSEDYARQTRNKIDDDQSHSVEYYEPHFDVWEDAGTTHASFLAPDGAAVAITSTINTLQVFGKKHSIEYKQFFISKAILECLYHFITNHMIYIYFTYKL